VAVGGGGEIDDAVDILLQMGPAAAAVRKAGKPEMLPVWLDVLRHALAPYKTTHGVNMPVAVWIVTGRQPS